MFLATSFLSNGGTFQILIVYAVLIVVLYFLFIRPNMKKKKEMQKIRDNIKRGDKIITIGGFVGTIESVEEDELVFRSSGTTLRIKRTAIHSIIEK